MTTQARSLVAISGDPLADDTDIAGLGPVAGVRFRRWRGFDADLPLMWAASDIARVADGEVSRNSLEGMAGYYRHLERYDPAVDLVIAETDPDGAFAGYVRVEWNDSNDGERWYEAIGIVDPAYRRHGIGRALLEWSERRRLAIAAGHAAAGDAPDRRRALTTFLFDGDAGGRALLLGAGYAPMRRFATMCRPDLGDIVDLPLPTGLEVRPVTRDLAELRRVFEADVEAFRDHFGWSEGSDENFAAFIEEPGFDPSLWVVAFDGNEVAGAVLTAIHVTPDGGREGWLDTIFTRRPWRQRGLARALIARSLAVLRDRGLGDASLGVDQDNLNQALALYESCGFRSISQATAYRKPLPEVASPGPGLREVPR